MATLSCLKYEDENGRTQRIYIIDEIAKNWKRFGLILGFSFHLLDNYEEMGRGRSELCCNEMMANWLKGHVTEGPITWNTLVEALRNARMDQLADKLITALPNSKDDLNAESILAKALRCGHIKMIITKLLLSGAAATGKSSLIALLLGQPPVRKHNSTLLSRPVRHACFTAEEDMKWECFDVPAKRMKLLAEGIEEVPTSGQSVQSSARRQLPSQEPENLPTSLASGVLERGQSSLELDEPQVSSITEASTSVVSTSSYLKSYKESRTFTELVPIIEQKSVSSNRLQTVQWIYTIDSGGQPAFLDILPAFIRGNSVNIHTLKLNEPLSNPVKMVYSVNGEPLTAPQELCLTNLQHVETLIRSASSSHFCFHPSCKDAKPRCMIVGTFKDKANDCSETIEEKNCQLKTRLQHCKDMLIDTDDGGWIFPVNCLVEGDERDEVASELREVITDTYGTYQETDIPVKWFVFELELRKHTEMKKQPIITMDKCKEIGRMFEMDNTEVEECVKYLHEQTILLFFDKILPDIIFINTQSILDKVSAILFISYLQGDSKLSCRIKRKLPPNTVDNLRQHGLLDRELLNYLHKLSSTFKLDIVFPTVFTPEKFLKLIEHLLVVAKLPEVEKYFMPCVLSTKPLCKQQKDAYSKSVSALFLCWKEMHIPQGLFPALVVQLLQREETPIFTLPHSTKEDQLRNAIILSSESTGGAVLLVDSVDWMEVYFSGPSSECPQIRHAILEGVSEVVKKFGYQPELRCPREGFLCCGDGCKPSAPHPCLVPIDQDRSTVTCQNKLSVVYKCSERQLCWFANKVYASEPSDRDLMNYVAARIPDKWHLFGQQLDIPTSKLNTFRSEFSPEQRFSMVFSTWKRTLSRTPITWATILTVLKSPSINEQLLAKELSDKEL